MEEDYLPHSLCKEEAEKEEERRLLYVGITRAKQNLHLSYVQQRLLFGSQQYRLPSPFLKEIGDSIWQEGQESLQKHDRNQSEKVQNYFVNEKVKHARYGKGIIKKVENLPVGQRLSVCFIGDSQTRVFLSQFAPFQKC